VIADAVRIAKEALVKPFEGYHKRLPDGGCKAYPDPGTRKEPWTIGWGSTGPDIGPETIWTLKQAEAALDAHLLYFASGALRLSPGLADEPPRRLAAIISFCYNCGLGNYRISRLRARVNEKAWDEACEQLPRWNKAAGRVLPGLTRRRLAEAALLR
jgi:GH24 family phage-related lysozyme (muramidase)